MRAFLRSFLLILNLKDVKDTNLLVNEEKILLFHKS